MRRLNIPMLIATLVAGIVAGVADLGIYNALSDTMARPLLIALMMGLFALIVLVAVTVTAAIQGNDSIWFLDGRLMVTIGSVVCLLLVFLGTLLFEWIYDHQQIQTYKGSSYIFVLDESGSMGGPDGDPNGSDPEYQRYAAVNEVMDAMEEDFPYAAYTFSSGYELIRDMAPQSAGKLVRPANVVMGMTNIRTALEGILEDIRGGRIAAGTNPHVILLTDGYASDIQTFLGLGSNKRFIEAYRKAGIPISTVGLGHADAELLQEIADGTGGSYVAVADASQLAQGFGNVTSGFANRDLLSERNLAEKDGLYAFLRILFLVLIGLLVTLAKIVASGNEDDVLTLLIVGAAASVIGALLMEFGLKLGLSEVLCRMVYWIGLAITPGTIYERVITEKGSGVIRALGGNRKKQNKSSSSGGKAGQIDW